MDNNTRTIATATLIGLAGGVVAFLLLTDRGRGALRRVGPALDDVSHSFEDVRTIVQKLGRVVQEANAMVTNFRDGIPSTHPDDDDQERPPSVA